MKVTEIISEHKTTPRRKSVDDASQGAIRMRDVGGYDRVYHLNRIMMATAVADGHSAKAVDSPADTWFEKYNTAHPYTKEEELKLRSAMKTVPTDGAVVSSFGKSKERDGVNTTSPVAKPKKNKYGV